MNKFSPFVGPQGPMSPEAQATLQNELKVALDLITRLQQALTALGLETICNAQMPLTHSHLPQCELKLEAQEWIEAQLENQKGAKDEE